MTPPEKPPAPFEAPGKRTLGERFVYFLTRVFVWITGGIWFRLSVSGREKIPADGPVLLVANHASNIDPLLIGTLCPRMARYMAKAELWESWLLKQWLNRIGAFPVTRGGADRAALHKALNVLRAGEVLLVFPEGTRTRTGELQEAKPGVAMLAAAVEGVAVVPVRIRGNFEAWGPGKKFPSPRKVTVAFGEPFRVGDLADPPSEKKLLYQALAREMMQRIAAT